MKREIEKHNIELEKEKLQLDYLKKSLPMELKQKAAQTQSETEKVFGKQNLLAVEDGTILPTRLSSVTNPNG